MQKYWTTSGRLVSPLICFGFVFLVLYSFSLYYAFSILGAEIKSLSTKVSKAVDKEATDYEDTAVRSSRNGRVRVVSPAPIKASKVKNECSTAEFVKASPGRDFSLKPVRIGGSQEDTVKCAVPCHYLPTRDNDPTLDARIDKDVLLTMESAVYYPGTEVSTAHHSGFKVVMTPRLDSDVPVGYFSWAEYGLMDPVTPRIEGGANAVAVISNCGGNSFRMKAIERLEKAGITIDKFGSCFGKRFAGSKQDLLRKYKFYLAFENSIEKDYVTEKYFQALVAGAVPVVIGAPNIEHFIPDKNAIIYIQSLEDTEAAAKEMKILLADDQKYQAKLAWKKNGPSQEFLALVDMAVVHSYCRLCIHLATNVVMDENLMSSRSCRCNDGNVKSVSISVRERGMFEFDEVVLHLDDSIVDPRSHLSEQIQRHFQEREYKPIWIGHRPDYRQSEHSLEVYRVYKVGESADAALFGDNWSDGASLKKFLFDKSEPCPLVEVIFT